MEMKKQKTRLNGEKSKHQDMKGKTSNFGHHLGGQTLFRAPRPVSLQPPALCWLVLWLPRPALLRFLAWPYRELKESWLEETRVPVPTHKNGLATASCPTATSVPRMDKSGLIKPEKTKTVGDKYLHGYVGAVTLAHIASALFGSRFIRLPPDRGGPKMTQRWSRHQLSNPVSP